MTPSELRKYRQLRAAGWLAFQALWHVRYSTELDQLESDEWIRFEWQWDDDYRPESGIAEYDNEERANLESGRWEVQGCIAEVPSRDPIGWPTGKWEHAASLWGIVGPYDCTDHDYRRDVELELAIETGVLEARPLIH